MNNCGLSIGDIQLYEEKHAYAWPKLLEMKNVNKQCLWDTPRTVRVSEKTWQVIVQTSRL